MLRALVLPRRLLLLALALALAVSLVVQGARAQAIPVPPAVPPSHLAAAFLLRYVMIPAVERLAAIKAALAAQGAAVAGATRSAFMLTSAAGASFSLTSDVHIAPVGYSTPGAANHGTGVVLENPTTQESAIVLVSTQPKEKALNPDLGSSEPPIMISGEFTYRQAPHIHFSTEFLGAGSARPLRTYEDFPSPMREWVLQQFLAKLDTIVYKTIEATSLVANDINCRSASGISGGLLSDGRLLCVRVNRNSGSQAWNWIYLADQPYKGCNPGLEYDVLTNTCNFKSAALDDGLCLVSPSSESIGYEYNKFDDDCIRAVSLGGMNLQPGSPGGNGAPPVSPSVTFIDPASGSVVIQEAPSLADPSAPVAQTTTRVPDRANNITVETKSTVSPGSQSSANPTAAPVQNGSEVNRYPGTNPAATPTGPPMQQVAVGNWPAVVKIEGTVTCSNCAQAGTGTAPPVYINVPDKVKIDGEVPSGSPTDLPAVPTDLKDADSFLEPIKDKFAGFMDFKLPAHTSSCPALHIQWRAWSVDLDVDNDFMCQFLAQHKQLMQGLAYFSYLATAIVIVLGA